jgi:hypothetical protein
VIQNPKTHYCHTNSPLFDPILQFISKHFKAQITDREGINTNETTGGASSLATGILFACTQQMYQQL